MKITLYPVYTGVTSGSLDGKTAVVLDVLRATSTIITALSHGCGEVWAVAEIEEARALADELRAGAPFAKGPVLLGGERQSKKIPGFDLGNSPLEYTPETVRGARLVMTTTNGTKAIACAGSAANILLGGLLNARAVARKILRYGRDVAFICAGTVGNYSLEDTVGAGRIIHDLLAELDFNAGPENLAGMPTALDLELSDLAHTALRLARSYHPNYRVVFDESLHGRRLAGIGLARDLDFCAAVNKFDVVPVLKDGRLVKG